MKKPFFEEDDHSQDIDIELQHRRVIIQHRYEVIHILNDIAIALWFLLGSIFFFFNGLKDAGIWLFVLGSAQMMVRPMIRIAHKIHVQRKSADNMYF